MSVEQTTQLIQLILNSVLMSVACALVLGGLTSRHSTLSNQLQVFTRSEDDSDAHRRSAEFAEALPRRTYSRTQLRRFQSRYQLSRYSVLAAYYALLFSVFSCFALALRGLLQWNGLITLALSLFVLGVTILLLAIGLTLVDLHLGDFWVGEEIKRLFNLSMSNGSPMPSLRSRSQSARRDHKPALSRTVRPKMRAG